MAAAQSFHFWPFGVLGGCLFSTHKLKNPKILQSAIDKQGPFYLPMAKSLRLFAPTARDLVLSLE